MPYHVVIAIIIMIVSKMCVYNTFSLPALPSLWPRCMLFELEQYIIRLLKMLFSQVSRRLEKWPCRMTVIVSALLQQRSLDPDQPNVRLPHYVPPRCKTTIARHLKMFVCSHDAHYFSEEPVHWKFLYRYNVCLPSPWLKESDS